MGLFRKKKVDEIEEEIKKYPKKERKMLRLLLDEYNKGKILQVDKDIDNKEYVKSRGVQ